MILKTLNDTVEMAINDGPIKGIRERIHKAIKDFIVLKFENAYAKTKDKETLKILKELFADITA